MALSSTALGINGVWWAFAVTSIIKGIVFFAGFLAVLKRMEKRQLLR